MKKSVKDILVGGESNGSANKYRDMLGKTLLIKGFRTVNTSQGESVIFTGEDSSGEDVDVWAPSVVAKQLRELEESEWLPMSLTLWKATSQTGREYFTLVDPEDEGADGAEQAVKDAFA